MAQKGQSSKGERKFETDLDESPYNRGGQPQGRDTTATLLISRKGQKSSKVSRVDTFSSLRGIG